MDLFGSYLIFFNKGVNFHVYSSKLLFFLNKNFCCYYQPFLISQVNVGKRSAVQRMKSYCYDN